MHFLTTEGMHPCLRCRRTLLKTRAGALPVPFWPRLRAQRQSHPSSPGPTYRGRAAPQPPGCGLSCPITASLRRRAEQLCARIKQIARFQITVARWLPERTRVSVGRFRFFRNRTHEIGLRVNWPASRGVAIPIEGRSGGSAFQPTICFAATRCCSTTTSAVRSVVLAGLVRWR